MVECGVRISECGMNARGARALRGEKAGMREYHLKNVAIAQKRLSEL